MKINYENQSNLVNVGDILVGNNFVYKDDIYISAKDEDRCLITCVNLRSGYIKHFAYDTKVNPIICEVNIIK